ncbi:MAG: phosphohydrolase [Phycisphaerae bacterium]
MSWIQTYTGKQFYPLDPDPSTVCLTDIAHALSLKCRFGGHCRDFYSVAEHSVRAARAARVARWGNNNKVARFTLLHDAAEAYIPDFARPIKGAMVVLCRSDFYRIREWEQQILWAIGVRLNIDLVTDRGTMGYHRIVKWWDEVMLATEARDLMGVEPGQWPGLPDPIPETIEPWSPQEAEQAFLDLANELGIRDEAKEEAPA